MGMTYVDPPELDHIVHLVPSGNLHDACEQFRKLGFSVESGGGMLQCMKGCNKLTDKLSSSSCRWIDTECTHYLN